MESLPHEAALPTRSYAVFTTPLGGGTIGSIFIEEESEAPRPENGPAGMQIQLCLTPKLWCSHPTSPSREDKGVCHTIHYQFYLHHRPYIPNRPVHPSHTLPGILALVERE